MCKGYLTSTSYTYTDKEFKHLCRILNRISQRENRRNRKVKQK